MNSKISKSEKKKDKKGIGESSKKKRIEWQIEEYKESNTKLKMRMLNIDNIINTIFNDKCQ